MDRRQLFADLSLLLVALIFATEPVFAALFGYLLLQERLGWRDILGCALILAGMVVGEAGLFNKKLLTFKGK